MRYPGHHTSVRSLRSTVEIWAPLVQMTDHRQRRQVVIRVDAGFGSDATSNWLRHRGDQVLGKGYRSTRAATFARQVRQWQPLDRRNWMAPAPPPLCGRYYRRTQTLVLRWQHSKTRRFTYARWVSSLRDHDLVAVNDRYDDRASIENAITAATGGVRLPRRRNKHLHAQDAVVLRTDLAHHIFAWTRRLWAAEPASGPVGISLIINEILTIPGKLGFADRQFVTGRLQATHPLAKPVLSCLSRLFVEY